MPQPKYAIPRNIAVQGASTSPLTPLVAINALKEEAISPKVTDQECPTATATTDVTGEKPRLISKGATMAMGTPKPDTPCKKELKNPTQD